MRMETELKMMKSKIEKCSKNLTKPFSQIWKTILIYYCNFIHFHFKCIFSSLLISSFEVYMMCLGRNFHSRQCLVKIYLLISKTDIQHVWVFENRMQYTKLHPLNNSVCQYFKSDCQVQTTTGDKIEIKVKWLEIINLKANILLVLIVTQTFNQLYCYWNLNSNLIRYYSSLIQTNIFNKV